MTHAATLCMQERFEASNALEFIERHRCTVYYGVAPMTRALAASPDLPRRDISSLRTGTANATPEDLRLAIEVLGVERVCNAYGLTEAYGHSTMTTHTDPPQVRMSTQGRPMDTQELRVVDSAGEPAPPGRTGRVQVRGLITPGYLDAPELNDLVFDADGWFSTGDLGLLDVDGRFHFVGRAHEMMKIKGINVSPSEVETLLVRHALVDEAFVFGMPTPEGDEQVGCAVVSSASGPERDSLPVELTSWAREQIATYKVPTRFWVLRAGDLPLTSTGKVSKRLLQDKVTAQG